MDPLQAIGATKAVGEAMGDSALSAMRFLAAAGWLFGAVMLAAAAWAIRGRLLSERRTHVEAIQLANSLFGTTDVLDRSERSVRRRSGKRVSNPGLPPGGDT